MQFISKRGYCLLLLIQELSYAHRLVRRFQNESIDDDFGGVVFLNSGSHFLNGDL